MTNLYKTKIIVLKKAKFQESSLLINSISPELGRLDFVIKGALRIDKKKSPIVDLFRELEIEFKESKNNLHNPSSVDLIHEYDKVELYPKTLFEIGHISKFILKNIHIHVECHRVYNSLKTYLALCCKNESKIYSATLLKLVFLSENGFLPEILSKTDIEDKKQHQIINTLLSYSEGKSEYIPNYPEDYWKKFNVWINNLCQFNEL